MATQNSAKLLELQRQAATLGLLVIDASTSSPCYQIFFENQLIGSSKSMKAASIALPELYRAIQEQLAEQVATEVAEYIEAQAEAIAPEFAAGIAGDNVAIQLQPVIDLAPAALTAFLNHTASTADLEVASAHFNPASGLLQGSYYCEDRIAHCKIFINFAAGTYSRHDEFPNGSWARWGSEYGMTLSYIDFDNWDALTPPPPEPEDFIQVRVTADPTVFQIFSRPPHKLKPNEYSVKLWESGRMSCTCPHHYHRGVECKHIQAVKRFLDKRKNGRSLSPTIGHRQHGYLQSKAEKSGTWRMNLNPTGLYTHEHFRQRERSQQQF